jgi:hypothetical protein
VTGAPAPRLARLAALALAACLSRGASAAPAPATHRHHFRELPSAMVWAWEAPQDLRALDPRRAGVAFLAGTVTLAPGGVAVRPRMQPLRFAPGAPRVAVVRLEAPPGARLAFDAAQRAAATAAIVRLARTGRPLAVQVDFDAPRAARGFYRALLADVRRELPDSLALGMTALASWALGDRWLDGLPVEEAVPMVFRMGADDARVRAALARGVDFEPAICRGAVGVALDEPWPALARTRRVYVFYGRSWTGPRVAALQRRLGDQP